MNWDKNKLPTINKFIEYSEGYQIQVYKCSAGKDTIGIGRNIEANPLTKDEIDTISIWHGLVDKKAFDKYIETGITKQDADLLLSNDIKKCKTEVAGVVSYFPTLPSYAQYVLIDLTFNVGIGAVKKFKKMLVALDSATPDYDTASVELLHCGVGGYLFDVKGRAVRNAKLLCSDWDNVFKVLAARKGTTEHIKAISQYSK